MSIWKSAKLFILFFSLGFFLILTTSTLTAQPLPDFVFVKQQPLTHQFATISDIFGNFQGYYPPDDQPTGGNLYRRNADGTVVNLTALSNFAVRDPEVSYDGTKVLFSAKNGGFGKWQVWEIGVDGSGLRLVSRDDSVNDLDPAYMPDGRILFTTDRTGWADGYENLPAAQMAVMNSDGTGAEVVKHQTSGHFNPIVGSDGMVYFSQWDFYDRRDSITQNNHDLDVNRFLLWKIFADGSGLDHPHYGAHSIFDFSGGYVEVREVPGAPNTFVGTLADEFFTMGGGSIVRMIPRPNQNQDNPQFITENVFMVGEGNTAGRWRSPYPLGDGRILASYSPGPVFQGQTPEPSWRIVVMNGNGSNQQELHHDASLWSWQPVPIVARTPPPVVQGEMRAEFPYAIMNALDVTLRGRNGNNVVNGDFQPGVPPGAAQQVRVLRQNVRSANYYNDFPDHSDPDVEVIGTAPIHSDGSFAVVIPADTPVTWELLGNNGQVLVRERFGAELRAGEIRTCGGCHAPHNGNTGNQTNFAISAPTNLSGQNVDLNNNGIIDLLEVGGDPNEIFADGFESGDLSAW